MKHSMEHSMEHSMKPFMEHSMEPLVEHSMEHSKKPEVQLGRRWRERVVDDDVEQAARGHAEAVAMRLKDEARADSYRIQVRIQDALRRFEVRVTEQHLFMPSNAVTLDLKVHLIGGKMHQVAVVVQDMHNNLAEPEPGTHHRHGLRDEPELGRLVWHHLER